MKEKISILLPLYNDELYIKKAIQSVFANSYKNFELVVINDGSNDNSLEIVKSINDDEPIPVTLEDDCVFVLGDNRNLSNDSRAFGCVPIENIKGNLALRLWPIKDIKLFR